MTQAKKSPPVSSWQAKVDFSAELNGDEVSFKKSDLIPETASQTLIDLWEERGLIEEADPKA